MSDQKKPERPTSPQPSDPVRRKPGDLGGEKIAPPLRREERVSDTHQPPSRPKK